MSESQLVFSFDVNPSSGVSEPAPEPESPPPEAPPAEMPSNAPATRRAAYIESRHNASKKRRKILGFLLQQPNGATDEEGQLGVDMKGDSYRPRRRELVKAGLVEDSGSVRPTSSGRVAVVWHATPKGRAWHTDQVAPQGEDEGTKA